MTPKENDRKKGTIKVPVKKKRCQILPTQTQNVVPSWHHCITRQYTSPLLVPYENPTGYHLLNNYLII